MTEAIIDAPAEVTRYLDQVQQHADANRNALGFLPATAYGEAAMKGCLWVVVGRDRNKLRGYLFFGGTFPRLKVYQVYVCPEYRSSGTARRLIEKLKRYGEAHDYLSITARVASELPANRFWSSLGFKITSRTPGRTKGRTINRYALALNVPSLFGLEQPRSLPRADAIQKAIRIRPVLQTRSYVIDLNVLFDALRDRDHGEARRILAMGFDSDIRLVVTSEFAKELERHSRQSDDPVLKLAKALPTLSDPGREVMDPLVDNLRRALFSAGTPKTGKGVANDASDLVHLASCIHHNTYGFITRDRRVLRRAEDLHKKYGLRVISPADLCEPFADVDLVEARPAVAVGPQEVKVTAFDERDRAEVQRFLEHIGIPREETLACLAPDTGRPRRTRSVVRVEQRIVGVGSWKDRPGASRETLAWLYVDEASQCVDSVIDYLLERSINLGNYGQLRRLDMKLGPDQVKIRDVALKRGFCSPDFRNRATSEALTKVSIKGPVTTSNWQSFRNSFKEATGRELPSNLPHYKEISATGVLLDAETDNESTAVSLFDFETVISPGPLVCPGRDAVIVPIREGYADQLLSLAKGQQSLWAAKEAALRLERAYFLNADRIRSLSRGTIVVFYVSRSRSEAVAMGRVTFSGALTKKEAVLNLGRQGVLTEEKIQQKVNRRGKVGAFTFDNLVAFQEEIPYSELKRTGCIGAANLVTVQRLPYEKLRLITERAFALKIP